MATDGHVAIESQDREAQEVGSTSPWWSPRRSKRKTGSGIGAGTWPCEWTVGLPAS